MSDWPYTSWSKRDGVTIPKFWVAIALSVLLHIAVMLKWLPQIHLPSLDDSKRDDASGSLVVHLAPPPRPPSPPPSPPSPPPSSPSLLTTPAPTREARPVARPQPAPNVIALNRPAPELPAAPPPAPPVAAPAPPRPPAEGDLASYIEARRRARSDSAPPAPPASNPGIASAPQVEDDKSRSNRIVAANLGTGRQTFGYDPSKSGGLFEIKRVGFTDAEFAFFGWDKGIRRNTMQLIEVQKGNNSDTRIAIVRRMIAIIRDNTEEDFLWESQRLARVVTLSPRLRDNAGLEQFLMREFFPEDPRSR